MKGNLGESFIEIVTVGWRRIDKARNPAFFLHEFDISGELSCIDELPQITVSQYVYLMLVAMKPADEPYNYKPYKIHITYPRVR